MNFKAGDMVIVTQFINTIYLGGFHPGEIVEVCGPEGTALTSDVRDAGFESQIEMANYVRHITPLDKII